MSVSAHTNSTMPVPRQPSGRFRIPRRQAAADDIAPPERHHAKERTLLITNHALTPCLPAVAIDARTEVKTRPLPRLRTRFPRRLRGQQLRPMNDGQDVNFLRGDLVDHTVLSLENFAEVRILVLGNHLPELRESGDLP